MPRDGHKFSSWSIRLLSTHFNPHAPRWARLASQWNDICSYQFQSTCPARGTTCRRYKRSPRTNISIHVPRDGHDIRLVSAGTSHFHFNPRAPRGARRKWDKLYKATQFISIHVPREGHDHQVRDVVKLVLISIHVPREGHDLLL